jgi:hypothetical protein
MVATALGAMVVAAGMVREVVMGAMALTVWVNEMVL